MRRFTSLAAALAASLVLACGGGDSITPDGPSDAEADEQRQFGSLAMIREGGDNSAQFEVELAPEARSVEGDVVRDALADYDRESGRYVFEGEPSEVTALAPGEVVLFKDHSLARIEGVSQESGQTVVETSPATLAEYIDTGELGWDYEVDFGSAEARSWLKEATVFLGPVQLQPQRSNEAAIKYSGKLGSYDLTIEITPSGERLNISAEAKKTAGGQNLQYVATGWIENFRSEGNIAYDSGELQNFSYQNKDFSSELDLKFVATRLGEQPELFAIPLRLDIPMSVYGVPMTLGLGANLKVVPHLTGESSSEVGFKVKYAADTGFQWAPGSARALGSLDEKALELAKGDTAGFGPVGLGVGLEFPVMQLSILG